MRVRWSRLVVVVIVMLISQVSWAQATIQVGEMRVGNLTETDRRLDSDDSFYDWYVFPGRGGQRIKIELKSQSFAPYLVLLDRDGTELVSASGTTDGRPARVEITLSYTGRYHIRVNSLHKDGVGRYTLSIKQTS
jgi:hypothetical protein